MLSQWSDLDKVVNRWGLIEGEWEYRIAEKGDGLFYTSYRTVNSNIWSDEMNWFDTFLKARNFLQREIGMEGIKMYRYIEYKRLGKSVQRKLKS